jgi:hypothetical protein
MKYVKCVYSVVGSRLTLDKIYEVLDYYVHNECEFVEIIDNTGDKAIYSVDKDWFIDATADIRNDKLIELLK